MWKKIKRIIKRIIKSAILMSIGICIAKGTYEEGPEPELLTTEYTEPAMEALEELAYGELPTLPTVSLPQVSLPTVSLPGVSLPSLQLPGISGLEKELIGYGTSLIRKLVEGKMPEAFQMGLEKIKSVLGGEYNPLTSPYYAGLKEEAARFEEKGISDIRQRSQLGGMLYSEPAMGVEAEFRGILGTGLTKELGRLYEADVGRQTGMISQLLGYAGLEAGMPGQAMGAISAFAPLAGKSGDITRQQALIGHETGVKQSLINQQTKIQELMANLGVGTQQAMTNLGQLTQQQLINQQVGMEQAMLPYTTTAPLLQGLADWGTWYQPEMYYTPGPFDYLLGFAGAVL